MNETAETVMLKMLRIIQIFQQYFIRKKHLSILCHITEIEKCNSVCKFGYSFCFLNTETFYSQLNNEIHVLFKYSNL